MTGRVRALDRGTWAVTVAVVLVAAWYVAAMQLGSTSFFGAGGGSAYNRLAASMLHGRVDLGLPVPPGLERLKNPYDPVANGSYRTAGLHDLSLYHDKLYAYWGPVPAVLLYLPVHAAGQVLRDGWAVLVLCLGSFLLSVALLLVTLRRAAVRAGPVTSLFAVLGLGVANLAAHLLSRPEQYEVAIAAGTFFAVAALLCTLLADVRDDAPRLALLAAASAAAGLAAGSRATTGLVIVAPVALLALRLRERRDEPWGARLRLLAAGVGPFAVLMVGVLAYNVARFGTPTEFGRRWQLTVVDFHATSAIDLSVIGPSLWNYLVPPPLLRAQFPFLVGNGGTTYPLHLPGTYISGDAVIGVLWLAPILLALLFAPRWWRRGTELALRTPVALLFGTGLVLFAPLLVLRGAPAAVRYEADFLPAWTLAALLLWLAALARRPSRLVAVAGCVALGWSAVVAASASIDNDQVLSDLHPATFHRFESAFSPVSTGMAILAGHPILAKVGDQPGGPPYRYDRLGVNGASVAVGRDPIEVRIVSPGVRDATLTGTGDVRVNGAGATRAPLGRGAVLHLRQGLNVVTLRGAGSGAAVQVRALRLGS